MIESPTSSTLHPAEDYEFLRSEALAHIQRLSGALWSDYNAHDPGVTMLEILCFALADVGFRSGHPIEDILTPIANQKSGLKQFFTIAEVATSRPWSINDYRSLLIDLPFIANAWLSKSNRQEIGIALNDTNDGFELQGEEALEGEAIRLNGLYEVAIRFEEDPEFGDLNDNSVRFWDSIIQVRPAPTPDVFVPTEIEVEFPFQSNLSKRLHLLTEDDVDRFEIKREGSISGEEYGWYFRFVHRPVSIVNFPDWEQEEFVVAVRCIQGQDQLLQVNKVREHMDLAWWKDTIKTYYLPRRASLQAKLDSVKAKLLENRNLCEDFHAIVPMDLQEIALELDLEVEDGFDLAEIEVAIYDQMRDFLDPPLRFYALSEMLEKGYSTEEIFDGPHLNNGFLDREELRSHQARKRLHASDLTQLIMAVDGVKTVRKLQFANRIAGEVIGSTQDCLILTEPGRFQATIDIRRSEIRFYKGRQAAEQADKLSVIQNYRAGLFGSIINKGIPQNDDIPIEFGRNRQLDAYYSIQEDFPLAWGIGSFGLSNSEPKARHAKAKQLKAYLYFFEQILANYLEQLNYVKRLFAVEPDIELASYVSKVVHEVPGMSVLFAELNIEPGEFALVDFSIDQRLQNLVDEKSQLPDRLNRLYDHLMARFNESISDWTGRYWTLSNKTEAETLFAAKQNLLRNYSQLGIDRAGGLNYGLNSSESGFNARIRALLGWDSTGHPMENERGFWILEHILIRPKETANSTLKPRISEGLPGFDVSDPWSCRLSIIVDSELAGFADHDEAKAFFQRMIRAELPAHLYVDFYWIGHFEAVRFEAVYEAWLDAYDPDSVWTDDAFVNRFNGLKNLWGGISQVLPIKKKSQLEPGAPLARVYDNDGEIVKAWISKYDEPLDALEITPEIELNRKTGEITFTGANTMDGIDDLYLSYATMNIAGGITHHEVLLNIVQDQPPVYSINHFDFDIESSMKVATVSDPDNTIVIAELIDGTLPAGTQLNLVSGDIEVQNLAKLKTELANDGKIYRRLRIKLTNDENLEIEVSLRIVIVPTHPLDVEKKYDDSFAITQFIQTRGYHALYEISDDQDKGIKTVKFFGFDIGVKGPELDPKSLGLRLDVSGSPDKLVIAIDDFDLFSNEFFKVAAPNGSSTIAVLLLEVWDGYNLSEELALELKFRTDHQANLFLPPAKDYQSYMDGDVIMMVRELMDGGIEQLPYAGNLPGLEWFSAIPIITNLPQYKLLVKDAKAFMEWVEKDFTLNFSTDTYTYSGTITTWDVFKGKTTQPFEIEVLRGAIGSGSWGATVHTLSWKSNDSIDIDTLSDGVVIAEAHVSDDGIIKSASKVGGKPLADFGISLRIKDALCELLVTNSALLVQAFYSQEASMDARKNRIEIPFTFSAKVENSDDLEVNAVIFVGAAIEKGTLAYRNNTVVETLQDDDAIVQVHPQDIMKMNVTAIEVSGFLNPGLETELLSSGGGLIRVEDSSQMAGGIFDYELVFKDGSREVAREDVSLKFFAPSMEMHIERNQREADTFVIDLGVLFPGINTRVYTSYSAVPGNAAKCARTGLRIQVETFNDYFLQEDVGFIKAYVYLPEMGSAVRVTLYIYLHAEI